MQHFFFLVQDYGSWLDIGTRWASRGTLGLKVLINNRLITRLLHANTAPPCSPGFTCTLSLAALAITWSWCWWPSSWCCSAWSHTPSPHEDLQCGGDPRCTFLSQQVFMCSWGTHSSKDEKMAYRLNAFFFFLLKLFSYLGCFGLFTVLLWKWH